VLSGAIFSDRQWPVTQMLRSRHYLTHVLFSFLSIKSPNNTVEFVIAFVVCILVLFLTGTVIVRLAIFPLFVFVQRNMVIMNNHMPTVQKLQDAFSKARRRGDLIEGQLVVPVVWLTCLVLIVDWVVSRFKFYLVIGESTWASSEESAACLVFYALCTTKHSAV